MVRQLSLKFAYTNTSAGIKPASHGVAVALGFALAESHRANKKITGVGLVSFPFWSVQVSETRSILLNAFGKTTGSFELTSNTALSQVKRILSTETQDAKSIPDVVEKILPLLGKIERTVQYIKNIETPQPLAELGPHFVEIEPGIFPNRLDTKIDSQDALLISEAFQAMVEAAETKIRNMEEIQKLSKENLVDKLNALENVIASEKERWERRARTQAEIEELEITELAERKKDEQYKIEEKYKIAKRALTSEFARDTNELELFFSGILGKIQEVRVEIGQKGDDFEAAVELFKALVNELDQRVTEYKKTAENILAKSEEKMKQFRELEEKMDQEIKEAARSIDSQIRDKNHRLVEFNMERNKSEMELDELYEKVVTAVKSTQRELEKRLEELRAELDGIMDLTFKNDLIPTLTPLTMIDVETFGVLYEDGSTDFFVAQILPDDRFGLPLDGKHLSEEFHKFFVALIQRMREESPTFDKSVQMAVSAGDIIRDEKGFEALKAGLEELQMKQLLKEGVKERLTQRWQEISGDTA